MVSIIGIIGTFPIVFVFGMCFGLTLRSYLKNPDITKIFFMISFISIATIYLSWGLRVLIVPQYEINTNIHNLIQSRESLKYFAIFTASFSCFFHSPKADPFDINSFIVS